MLMVMVCDTPSLALSSGETSGQRRKATANGYGDKWLWLQMAMVTMTMAITTMDTNQLWIFG